MKGCEKDGNLVAEKKNTSRQTIRPRAFGGARWWWWWWTASRGQGQVRSLVICSRFGIQEGSRDYFFAATVRSPGRPGRLTTSSRKGLSPTQAWVSKDQIAGPTPGRPAPRFRWWAGPCRGRPENSAPRLGGPTAGPQSSGGLPEKYALPCGVGRAGGQGEQGCGALEARRVLARRCEERSLIDTHSSK